MALTEPHRPSVDVESPGMEILDQEPVVENEKDLSKEGVRSHRIDVSPN